MMNVDQNHYREWVEGSAVDPEITNLNLKSLGGNSAYDYLLYSESLKRTNAGRLQEQILKRYHHLGDGGWWCSGVDVLTGEDSLWGCLKPNNPKFDHKKNKLRKYEQPEGIPTEIFALKISVRIFELVSRRYNVALPQDYQAVVELPWIFWQWVLGENIPIILVEGAKKAASVLSCGYVAIGLPGVWGGVRQPKDEHGNPDGMPSLIKQLQVFAQAGRRIYFCFDQDGRRETTRSVSKAIAKTAKLFVAQKCEVKVITWLPGLGKGIDDVLVAFGREKFDELYRDAATFDEWSSNQLRRLTYAPDVVQDQRYIGEILPPASAQLIAIKAPKGCGKTEWFRWFTAPQISSGERKTLLISHRIQLGLQTCDRLGLPFINQLKQTGQGSLFGYGLCIDSLHPKSQARFSPQEWRGATVIIDEIQQVIWHLLSSSTCQNERVIIIKTLQELLQTVIATNGKIIIADADLNDIAIDFIEGLLGQSPDRFILVNEFTFNEPWTIHKFGGTTPSAMIAELEKRLDAGEKALLCVSGQKHKSKWGTIVLEEYFKRKYPHLKILRIDSESVANPEHEAFGCTEDPNKIVINYDLVISSPTIETGVSINVKHFDGVWLISQGVQTTDGVRQFLSRVRPPVPRYVWIKSLGINFVGNSASTVAGLIASQKRLDKSNRVKLMEGGLKELPDGNFSPIYLETWAKLGAIINTGMWHHEKTILDDLAEEGHNVLPWSEIRENVDEENAVNAESLKEKITQVRDEVYQEYRENVTASNRLTDTEWEKLNKQQQRKTSELLELRKGGIERKYLVDCSSELIEKDDNRWGTKILLDYYWRHGREYLSFKDSLAIEKSVAHGGGDYFIVDSNRSLKQLKVDLLDFLGISRLYEEAETGFHSNHPTVVDIFEKIKVTAKDIKLVAGIDLTKLSQNEKNRIQCLQTILSVLGHKMTCYARTGKRLEQKRYYSQPAADFHYGEDSKLVLGDNGLPVPKSDGREEVFAAWLKRDAELRAKHEQSLEEARAAEASLIQAENARINRLLAKQQAEAMAEKELEQAIATLKQARTWNDVVFLEQKQIDTAWQQPVEEVTSPDTEAIASVDEAIRVYDPLFGKVEADEVLVWQRRLSKAITLSSDIARSVYRLLPQKILNEIWEQLTYGVQSKYATLFAS